MLKIHNNQGNKSSAIIVATITTRQVEGTASQSLDHMKIYQILGSLHYR